MPLGTLLLFSLAILVALIGGEREIGPMPRKQKVGGVSVRMWAAQDVERLRKYKQENYRKGRGRKPRHKR